MKRITLAIFGLVVLQVFLTTGARAQSGLVCIKWWACGAISLYNTTCYPTPPSSAFNCQVFGPWSMVCEVAIPCGVPKVWCPTCGKWVPVTSQPINLTNGNTYIQETDVSVPGLGGGLRVERTWNSIWPTTTGFTSGMFGLGWISTYEERVFQGTGDATGYMAYLRSDGGLWYFSNGALVAPENQGATLNQYGTSYWILRFQDGSQRTFDYASGSLTSITDRNGNTTTLTYDAGNRLTTVTDPASRHLYFSYGSGSQTLLVTSITSDIGISTSYSYDSQNRLTQATEPDGSTFNFQFDSHSLISAVVDSAGKTLEAHTYDSSGRGATASRANGVDGVTLSYQQ
ncbi:MAG TPA: DUF6531 domain-containing protein [Candidatus Eisenbacteria bacterium]|nr:DUF6531 domain-containing protein [Candidatus Eisenbacteria bacterium]